MPGSSDTTDSWNPLSTSQVHDSRGKRDLLCPGQLNMRSSKGGCLASAQASSYIRITSVVMFSGTYVFTDYVLNYSYIHCWSLIMCSCSKCRWRHDTLTSNFHVPPILLICALVFDITHSDREAQHSDMPWPGFLLGQTPASIW